MKHELKKNTWNSQVCVCGYRRDDIMDRSHAIKMMDLHFGSRHDFHEHVEIIHQLVDELAERPSPTQDVALAILHLVDCLEAIQRKLPE